MEVDVPINGVSQLQVDPAERYFKYLPYGSSLEYVRMYLHSYILLHTEYLGGESSAKNRFH